MNTLKTFAILIVMVITLASCKNETKAEVKTIEVATETTKEIDPNATYAKAEFTIDGMTCEIGCAKTIEKKLGKMDGVKSAKVDFENKLAMVEFNEAKVTTTSLEETVTKVADIYKVSNMKTVDAFSAN
ncbi:heavy-metal-associated domain-containing protein [Seonamhaeicola algicola]|uniref:Heavy-metal-associated domain-containing protein n=1 Tax=Seonamhaeicola algicola TaxID=1719036 RepID=A0A5C7ANL2_9FLAO|nr:heavy metal-associated domain-containing protein [Seonamhaeicola algicola]TXE09564.1 heavy-metal-associated domain-containing protein [Seonamhaeicola algicola]